MQVSCYVIKRPHADVTVMHNGKDNHDKIYVVAVMCHASDQYYCDIYGFYKRRGARKWNNTLINEKVPYPDSTGFVSAIGQSKLSKGYEVKWSDSEFERIGLSPLQSLARELELEATAILLKKSMKNSIETKEPVDVVHNDDEREQYECVDDYGLDGKFLVGCVYYGRKSIQEFKLEIENDEGKAVIVDEELFKLVK